MGMSWLGIAYTCQKSTFASSFAYLPLSSGATEANEVLLEGTLLERLVVGIVVKLSCYKVKDLVAVSGQLRTYPSSNPQVTLTYYNMLG